MTSCKSVKVTFCNYLIINTKPPFVRKTYNTPSWLFRHFISEKVTLFWPFCWLKNGFCWLKSPKIAIMMYGRFVFFAQRRDTKKEMLGYMTIANERGAHFVYPFTQSHFYTFTRSHFFTFTRSHFFTFYDFHDSQLLAAPELITAKVWITNIKKKLVFEDFD